MLSQATHQLYYQLPLHNRSELISNSSSVHTSLETDAWLFKFIVEDIVDVHVEVHA